MKNYILLFFVTIGTLSFSQNGVKIAPTVGAPDPSAMLEVQTTTTPKGILIPRIQLQNRTLTAPVANPANSLLVYNENFSGNAFNDVQPGYYYWSSDSTKWLRLISDFGSDDQNMDSAVLNGSILTIYIENGNSTNVDLSALINDTDSDITNELITSFSLVGDSLQITENGNTFYVHKDSIGTDDQNISSFVYDSITDSLTIGIEDGNTQTISLKPLRDHDWYEVGTTRSANNINDSIYTFGNVGIGLNNPTAKLTVFQTFAGPATDTNVLSMYLPQSSLGITHYMASGTSTLDGSINYGYRTDFNAIPNGTKYGVYMDGESQNYFSNAVGIGIANPTFKLQTFGANSDASINGIRVGRGNGDLITNTVVGNNALNANTTGDFNVAVGYQALLQNTTGIFNMALGAGALEGNTIGRGNVGIGRYAFSSNTSGNFNIGIGETSGQFNISGNENIAIGIRSLRNNTVGSNNIAIGVDAIAQEIGSSNIAIGHLAGYDVVGGTNNTYIGNNIRGAFTGSNNIIIGSKNYTIAAPENPSALASNNAIIINANSGAERIRIDNNGNTGIGAFDPSYRLDVNGQARIRTINDTNNVAGILSANAMGVIQNIPYDTLKNRLEDHDWYKTGTITSPQNINDSIYTMGNVGIGTNNPGYGLEIVHSDSLLSRWRDNLNLSGVRLKGVTRAGVGSGIQLQAEGSDDIHFAAGSRNTDIFIDGTSGFVGINTSTPAGLFHVFGGDAYVTDNTIGSYTTRSGNTLYTDNLKPASDNGMRLYDNNSNGHLHIGNLGYTYLQSYGTASIAPGVIGTSTLDFDDNANFDALTLNPLGGNVAVGTTAPEEKLVVNGIERIIGAASTDSPDVTILQEFSTAAMGNNNAQIGADRQFRILSQTNFVNTGRDWLVFEGLDGNEVDQDGGFIFRGRGNTGVERNILTIEGRGNVGVGITTPTERLHVNGDARIGIESPVGGTGIGYGNRLYFSGGPSNGTFTSENSDLIWFARYNNGVDSSQLRLNIGDNLTPIDMFNVGMDLAGTWTSTMAVVTSLRRVGINTENPTEALEVVGNILSSGTITSSDERYKKDIVTLPNALNNVLKLRGVSYYMKDEFRDKGFGTGLQIGVIAQEVEKVYPQLVITNPTGYKGVDYSKFTPILIEAIKEQQGIIEKQEVTNQQLSSELNEVKNELNELRKIVMELKEKK